MEMYKIILSLSKIYFRNGCIKAVISIHILVAALEAKYIERSRINAGAVNLNNPRGVARITLSSSVIITAK